MNLEEKILYYKRYKNKVKEGILNQYQNEFKVKFTHDSTAIEGNTLTHEEVRKLLTVNTQPKERTLIEINEVVNHKKAYDYALQCATENKELDSEIVKDIHEILMEDILPGGIYRNVNVYITGANHEPPNSRELHDQMRFFYYALQNKDFEDAIEKAVYTHAEFVRIHPFIDGNGRTSRIIMNYQLINNGLPPVSIYKEDKFIYFKALDNYASTGKVTELKKLIETLEEKELDKYIQMIKMITSKV